MRIGIEAQRIFRKNKHGMDYVVLQEIRELQKIDTRNEYFVFVAPGDDRCLEDTQNVHILEIGGDFYPLWEQVTLLKAVARHYLPGTKRQSQQIVLPEYGLVLSQTCRSTHPQEM